MYFPMAVGFFFFFYSNVTQKDNPIKSNKGKAILYLAAAVLDQGNLPNML